MSRDGSRILFVSDAALVPSDQNGLTDVYLRDRATQTTTLVSATPAGASGQGMTNVGSISPNGRWAAFASEAQGIAPELSTYLLDQLQPTWRLYLRDLQSGTTQLVSSCLAGAACLPVTPDPLDLNAFVSDDGDVAFTARPEVDEGAGRAAVWDRSEGTASSLVPLASGHTYPWGISADGDRVVFESSDPSLAPGAAGWTIYVFERSSGEVLAVPDAGDELSAVLSADGSTVAFNRFPTDPANLDATVHTVDLATGQEREVRAPDGAPIDGSAFVMGVSATGRFVTFVSYATNLVPDDFNGRGDVFLADTWLGRVQRVSVAADGSELPELSSWGAVSEDGLAVAFHTLADGGVNVYLRRR
jgi:Tol biopolymer transport system component